MSDPLWRVWFQGGTYKLVRAADTDHVYRSFKKDKRETITRVDRVLKTSEGAALPRPTRKRSTVRKGA